MNKRSFFRALIGAPIAAITGNAVARDPWSFGIDPYALSASGVGSSLNESGLTLSGEEARKIAGKIGARINPSGPQDAIVWHEGAIPCNRQIRVSRKKVVKLSRLRSMSDAAIHAYSRID